MTDVVAVDCEMVKLDGNEDGLGRVSIVNYHGATILDVFVLPPEGRVIKNYKTKYSGVTKEILDDEGVPFVRAKAIAHKVLRGAKIVVGHTLDCDFAVLEFLCDTRRIRDLSKCKCY